MAFDLSNLLQQYMGAANKVPPEQAEYDFDRIADTAPQSELGNGVAQAFRSDQTPPFPQMVSQLFGNSDPNQRAGMLNQMLSTLGPGVLASLGGGLGNLLKNRGAGTQQAPQITPEEAERLSPDDVKQVAERAEQEDPSIMDRMGQFYAKNPTLVKALGGAALAIALGHMAQGMRRQ
ncbi:hypothetical protein [Pseudoduganella sp. GCM10020061]|uniref:hypothetical protein n=1 Tax=Pseudoduganella sp. GCM10020061 TaxID=3317345 RepID=UPI00362BA210